MPCELRNNSTRLTDLSRRAKLLGNSNFILSLCPLQSDNRGGRFSSLRWLNSRRLEESPTCNPKYAQRASCNHYDRVRFGCCCNAEVAAHYSTMVAQELNGKVCRHPGVAEGHMITSGNNDVISVAFTAYIFRSVLPEAFPIKASDTPEINLLHC